MALQTADHILLEAFPSFSWLIIFSVALKAGMRFVLCVTLTLIGRVLDAQHTQKLHFYALRTDYCAIM